MMEEMELYIGYDTIDEIPTNMYIHNYDKHVKKHLHIWELLSTLYHSILLPSYCSGKIICHISNKFS